MSEVPMILTPYEAEAAAGGKLKVVIRPADPQPRKHHWAMLPDYRVSAYCGTYMDGVKVSFTHHHGDYVDTSQDIVRSPAQPGDVIVGLEGWAKWPSIELMSWRPCWLHAYKAGRIMLVPPEPYHNRFDEWEKVHRAPDLKPDDVEWRSAATMPPEFARHRWPVDSVECKRLGKISEEEAQAAGHPVSWTGKPYAPPQKDRWQGYGKASMSLCWDAAFPAYPWDGNPWVFMHWLGGE